MMSLSYNSTRVIIDGDKGRYEVFDVYSESNNHTV